MNKIDKQQSHGFQFGIRHAMVVTLMFAVLSVIAMSRFPSAPTISVQHASHQLQANNIESAVYYRGHDFAYLTTKVRIPVQGNDLAKRVRINDPESQFALSLKAAGVPYAISKNPPSFRGLLFGTGLIVALVLTSYAILKYRRHYNVHRTTA